jgi:hypothetical protein
MIKRHDIRPFRKKDEAVKDRPPGSRGQQRMSTAEPTPE